MVRSCVRSSRWRLAVRVLGVSGALGILVASAPVASAVAPAAPIACGAVLVKDTVLHASLQGCPGDGLIIGRDGIIVDLNGFSLVGSVFTGGPPGTVGIRNVGHDHVTIKGGGTFVAEFGTGVLLNRADHNRVLDLALEDEGNAGVVVNRSQDVQLARDEFAENLTGIVVDHSHDVRLEDNSLAENGIGILLDHADHNSVLRSEDSGEGQIGIKLVDSDRNVIRGNAAGTRHGGGGDQFTKTGIALFDSDRNRVVANQTNDVSAGDGIFVDPASTRNLVTENVADRNGTNGIEITNRHNTVAGNSANFNTALGILAPAGVSGRGNTAVGNGDPRQCVGARCN